MALKAREFLEGASEELDLKVVAGEEHLDRQIREPALNRPGLALAGFLQYFANKRVQVIGLAELNYLKSLSTDARRERVEAFFKKGVPAVVITRKRHVPKVILEGGKAHRVPVLKTGMITMDFINRATLMMERLTSPRMRIQGTMVDIMGVGVILQGEPGIGKSETAIALVRRGHSLISDDTTILSRNTDGTIVGSSVDITRFHTEIRGLGIVHVPSLFGVASMRLRMKLDLIIHLHHPTPGQELDRTGLTPKTREVMGRAIPELHLPVGAGRDISLIVEVAALNEKLKQLGHDAAKELDQKLIASLAAKRKS